MVKVFPMRVRTASSERMVMITMEGALSMLPRLFVCAFLNSVTTADIFVCDVKVGTFKYSITMSNHLAHWEKRKPKEDMSRTDLPHYLSSNMTRTIDPKKGMSRYDIIP